MRSIVLAQALCLLAHEGVARAQGGAPRARLTAGDPSPLPVLVGGYCVVSLRDRQQWQRGKGDVSAVFDGRQYRFASERQRAIFVASPASYAPMLGGDCPITFAVSGDRVHGELEYGLLHGDRLLFFASDAARRQFLKDPRPFAEADLAIGGHCAVMRVDMHRDVAGIAETAVLHGGLRYLFAGAFERSLFLRNPTRYDAQSRVEAPRIAAPLAAECAAPPPPLMKSPWQHPGALAAALDSQTVSDGEDIIRAALPALSGYCPVTIQRDGIWVRGQSQHRLQIGDLTFLAAGPREAALLEADPAAYVPACGGDCPVTLVTKRERVRGSVFQALEYQGRLFLFADAAGRTEFKAHPERYANCDIAAAGNCIVTQVDEQRETPGMATYATWHYGQLYRFAGPEQKARFLARPERYTAKESTSLPPGTITRFDP